MSKQEYLVSEIQEAVEIAYQAKLNHQILDDYAKQCYTEIFKDIERTYHTLHYYISYDVVGLNILRIKYYSNLQGSKYETIDIEIL